MSAKNIIKRTLKTRKPGKTDWKSIDALTDRDIEQAVGSDPDAAPILDKKWFKTAKVIVPESRPRRSHADGKK